MNNSQNLLQGYTSVPFKYTITNHIEITALVNGKEGVFLIDTGASNSCISLNLKDDFNLICESNEDVEITGIGSNNPTGTQISHGNTLRINESIVTDFPIVLLQMDHINETLLINKANELDGVIGGDFLELTKAVIDYNTRQIFFKK